nr:N-acetylmannosamine-6-phosphate 2-epimerase [Culicoidibacter larvae]
MDTLKTIAGGLVVSCQALEDEPLHSSFIMARMAVAAQAGGAVAIRTNSVEDITAIRSAVSLPTIGIIKQDYAGSAVYITPTKAEIDALLATGTEIIAMDATMRQRPAETLPELVEYCRKVAPKVLLMADIDSIANAKYAETLGFDIIAPTLMGYTDETKDWNIADNGFERLKQMLKDITTPIIAEGHIDTPEKAKRVLELGVHAVVVGGAITRPQQITERFVETMKK